MTIENALRHYLLQQNEVRNVLGNHIYAGRIPRGERPVIAALITRMSTQRYNDLSGEDGIVSPTLEIEFVSKAGNAPALALKAAEQVRLKVSCYAGTWGPAIDLIYVHSCTVERDVMKEPVWQDDEWSFSYSMDLRVTHSQTAVATP